MKFVFLGPQGSGKSTQAKLLAQKLSIPYFEVGQLLREKSQESDSLATEIKKALDQGHLVPDEITNSIVKKKTSNAKGGYVLDGYPRNSIQFAELDPDITKAFYVKVSDEESIKRLVKRGRSDDTAQVLSKRLEIYHGETEPLLIDFRNKGILDEVNGERPISEIHEEIMARVQDLI